MKTKFRFIKLLRDNFVEISQIFIACLVVCLLPRSWYLFNVKYIHHQNLLDGLATTLLIAFQVGYMFLVHKGAYLVITILSAFVIQIGWRRWVGFLWEYFWWSLVNIFFTFMLFIFLGFPPFWPLLGITQAYTTVMYIIDQLDVHLPIWR